jgi:hypothetical protein
LVGVKLAQKTADCGYCTMRASRGPPMKIVKKLMATERAFDFHASS